MCDPSLYRCDDRWVPFGNNELILECFAPLRFSEGDEN